VWSQKPHSQEWLCHSPNPLMECIRIIEPVAIDLGA
jgi:hypothetical protein